MTKAELKILFSDEMFLEGLREVDSLEKLQKFLAKKDLHMTMGDINKAIHSEAELSEQELIGVTGGGRTKWESFAWKCFVWSMEECE